MNSLTLVNDVEIMLGYELSATIVGTVSKETQSVVRACESVLSQLQGDRNWQELTADGSIRMDATRAIEGTTTITRGSTNLFNAGAGFLAADIGKLVWAEGTRVAYRISAYVDTSNVTISRAWVEDDHAAITYVFVGQDAYDLPTDYDRHLVEKFYNPVASNYVAVVGPDELSVSRQANGLALNVGVPEKCTIRGLNTAGTARVVHLDVCPEGNYELDFQYQKHHPALTTDTVLIAYPDNHLLYIKDMIKALLDRDNELSQTAAQTAQSAIAAKSATQNHDRSGTEPMRINPQVSPHGRRRRLLWPRGNRNSR
jgi:hypothetical protein